MKTIAEILKTMKQRENRSDIPKLVEALSCALTTLRRNATPALGGKAQQSDAQAALIELQAILSKP